MLEYPEAKSLAIDLLDDFYSGDLLLNYGPDRTYNAKTKLDAIEVTEMKRVAMVDRVNKVMRQAAGSEWHDVRAVDMVKCTSITDFIKLLCKNARVGIVAGEPK